MTAFVEASAIASLMRIGETSWAILRNARHDIRGWIFFWQTRHYLSEFLERFPRFWRRIELIRYRMRRCNMVVEPAKELDGAGTIVKSVITMDVVTTHVIKQVVATSAVIATFWSTCWQSPSDNSIILSKSRDPRWMTTKSFMEISRCGYCHLHRSCNVLKYSCFHLVTQSECYHIIRGLAHRAKSPRLFIWRISTPVSRGLAIVHDLS